MIKNLRRSVAEGGKIKIGGKGTPRPTGDGKGMWAPPRKDDHFTITTNMREGGDPNANLIVNEEIMSALAAQGWADGDSKIRKLPITLLHDEIDQVFPTAYVAYVGKRMACRGDGETATRYVGDDSVTLAEPQQVACPCPRLEKDDKGTRRCKFTGILHCALRLPGYAVIGSVYRWRTTSEISVTQIVTHLRDVILPAAGTLRGLPLVLMVRPQQVTPGGRPSTVHVCHIDLCEDLVIAQREALEAATMRRELAGNLYAEREASYGTTLQLPGAETPEEQAEIAPEYYPDEVIGAAPAGAAVQSVSPSARTDYDPANPLAGLGGPPPATQPPPQAQPPPSYTKQEGTYPQPAAQQPPPAEPEEPPRRKTRCKSCDKLFAPGIVVKGKCETCRAVADAPPPEVPPPAEPAVIPPSRPAGPDDVPPGKLLQQALHATIGRGVDQGIVLGTIHARWPDAETRAWTHADVGEAVQMLAGLTP